MSVGGLTSPPYGRGPTLPRTAGAALGQCLLGLLALLASDVKAGLSVNIIGLYDGVNAPIVEVQSTGNSGVWIHGDAQTATKWTFPNGSSIPLYCIDLTHENAVGEGKQKVSGTERRLSCTNVPETGSRHLICMQCIRNRFLTSHLLPDHKGGRNQRIGLRQARAGPDAGQPAAGNDPARDPVVHRPNQGRFEG